jgi:hypothetical protein
MVLPITDWSSQSYVRHKGLALPYLFTTYLLGTQQPQQQHEMYYVLKRFVESSSETIRFSGRVVTLAIPTQGTPVKFSNTNVQG